jgi:NAD(P)-dependent dehydrogenase (short-subunit alcohol dehydrogenase family)
MPLTGIKGKSIIITGGANGIGLGTARLFAKEGAKVVIVTGHSVKKAEDVVKELKGMGAESIFIQCDVRDEKQVEAMVARTVSTFGSVDFAFNNAGVGPEDITIPRVPLTEYEEQYWDKIIDTNLKGVFLCLKHELRQMRNQAHGVIVNTSSVGGLRPGAGSGAYGPSKAGVNHITRQAAEENRDLNIRVHAVCPGMIKDTGLTDRLWESSDKKGVPRPMEANAGVPEDIGKVVLFLCSDLGAFVDGSITAVAGNQMII